MPKIKLTVEYDGTDLVGWQLQSNGTSVQQLMELALKQLLDEDVRVHSSGRTDAGVHALGMVCHFTTARELPLSAWREGLNRFLPPAVAVRLAELVDADFHARYSAQGKHYRYSILRDPVRSPLERRSSWRVRQTLDLEQMRKAATFLVGRHNFAAFRTSGCSAETTERELHSIEMTEEGRLLHIDVCGRGFLRNMVRMLVGTLVDIGRGKRPVADIQILLTSPKNTKPAVTAPAHGLCLVKVWYG